MKTGKRLAAIIAVLIIAGTAFSLTIPPSPSRRVNDYAALLNDDEAAAIETRLKAIEGETSNQFVLAIFKSLEGGSLEDFSIRLADAWKIGQKGKDNGVILLLFTEDRKVRIEVGKGLEGVITDAHSGRIIREIIAPFFREGKYAAGLMGAVDALDKSSKGEFKAEGKKSGKGGSDTAGMAALFVIFGSIFGIAMLNRRRAHLLGRRGGGFYVGGFGGGFGGGGGGFGGGGFGGGGGGFGGGGASGGW